MENKKRVSVWGATGFGGGELMRLIARHPGFDLVSAISRSKAGGLIGVVHPHLRHVYPEMQFVSPEAGAAMDADLAFLALPHRASAQEAVRRLEAGQRVVDLSADFRLRTAQEYEAWYGVPHPAPELLAEAVYGLPELHRERMPSARLVSGVGCNATSAIMALLPLARAGVIKEVRMECRVGSSEGGSGGDEGSHHPYRSRSLRVVAPFVHRHMAEVVQELGISLASLSMGVTAVELVRGIQCLAHITLNAPMKEGDLWKLYRAAWKGEPFVSVCPARPAHLRIPDPRFVLGSNRVLVGFVLAEDGTRLLAASALDNLMKGAAGTAIQAANLMVGFDEQMGLDMMPVYPA